MELSGDLGTKLSGKSASARPAGVFERHARVVAAGLLASMILRWAWALRHGELTGQALPLMAAALALGGCLWWVAQRQVGGEAAALVLALYVSTPAVLSAPAALVPALGLFAMLYTGVGVAHALAGPRHKWPGRIGLMASICAFTGWAGPLACAAGLLLALLAMLWLMEADRRLLPRLFALWTGAALAGFFVSRAGLPHVLHPAAIVPRTADWWHYAGLLLAFGGALLIWCRHPRSRYFGHSAPLLAAILLFGLVLIAGWAAFLWALPPALLFLAGALDDGMGSKRARLWRRVAWSAVGLQVACALLRL